MSEDADIVAHSFKFESYIKGLEQIACGSFVTPALGMSKGCFDEKVPDAEQWEDMIAAMPAMSRRLKEPVYLLFGGSDIDSREIENNLNILAGDESLSGEYTSLSSIVRVKGVNLEPYEVKLEVMGLSRQLLSALRIHMDCISDSDVKEALQKTVLAMPWRKRAQVERNISLIRQKLDERLFGMDEASRR